MARLNINFEDGPQGVVCLDVSGSLDAHSFEEMEGLFERLFERQKYQIVVTIPRLEYVSSAGAGVFIAAASQAQGAGGNLILVDPTPEVREIFELLGVCQLFPVLSSREEAFSAFATV